MNQPRYVAPGIVLLAFGVGACGSPAPSSDEPTVETSLASQRDSRSDCDPRRSKKELSVELLGRYSTGLVGLESSGETAAMKDDRLYVTSAQAVALDVVDVDDPAAPLLIERVDLSAYGASVQSVDVSSRGLVAVAVGANVRTDPGTIVFLDEDGDILRTAGVGALPDMVVFTPDGKKLVVANEGEPGCYGEGCVDPEGSVSIVDVSPLKPVLPVTTLSFAGVPLPAGVRVFGPGATPEQDLEPEGVTVSENGKTAYVTLQENNALAVIDLKKAKVVEIRALGYKDLSAPPVTQSYEISRLPSIGSTAAGQEILLGGFSGLFFEGKTSSGKLKFLTHTDRGPNGEPTGSLRPFLLPDFTPRLVRLELDPSRGRVTIKQQIELKRADGTALTGLANTAVPGGNASSSHNDEIPVDLFGNVLGLDPLGGDFEGVAVDSDGSFWLADEYRPAIYHFDDDGKLIARLVPLGSHSAAGLPVPTPGAAGDLGIEALPGVLGQRRQNRGFEGIALLNGKIYAIVQSPLRNPTTLANSALNAMLNVRLVEVDPTTLATRQFLYIMDNPASVGADDTRADKIGDLAAVPGGGFLMVERDDDALPEDPAATITKKVYAFSLAGATDITSLDVLYSGKSLDQMTRSELSGVGVTAISKVLHIDLVQAGYANLEKVEGIAFVDPTTVAVINDNDFRVAGIVIDQTTGTFTLADGYQPEPEVLGLITTSGIDASDRDNVINIRNWPVWGMYQPDAVTSFKTCGETYLVTANEGDARDYDGFAEEERARDLASLYPGIPEVNDNAQLGRLTVTSAPPDGDFSRPYVFGARSFSLWSEDTGALVWDSGADLERVTAAAFPAFFNSSNDATSFDNRSDNKGPEPEGVTVGKIRGRHYAFVALERIGGFAVYDVTSGTPAFVTYVNTRDFSQGPAGPDSGPEIVRFVPAEDSPTHDPLLVVANEISGTVAIFSLE